MIPESQKIELKQELLGLLAQCSKADKHFFKISSCMTKTVAKESGFEMTPGKQRIIEEIKLNWAFVQTIAEDLKSIADELGLVDFPALPALTISNDLWSTETGGIGERIFETNNVIIDHQNKLSNLIFRCREIIDNA